MIKLYGYQQKVLDMVKANEDVVVHVVCPRGSGATTLAAELFLRRHAEIRKAGGSDTGLFATGARYRHLRDYLFERGAGYRYLRNLRLWNKLNDPEGENYLKFSGMVYGLVIVDGALHVSYNAMWRICMRIREKPRMLVLLDTLDMATEVSITMETLSEFGKRLRQKLKAEQKEKEEREEMLKVKEPEVRPDWLFGANPKAIEAQEKEGQASFVASTQLPIKGSELPIWENLGFKFGEPTDKLFRYATLPPGWKKVPVGLDNMWTDLVDEFGRVRGKVFYKAAFYDKRADMIPMRCLDLTWLPDGCVTVQKYMKGGRVVTLYTDTVSKSVQNPHADAWERAKDWRAENYPDWENPEAYWDDEDVSAESTEPEVYKYCPDWRKPEGEERT